MSVINAVLKDLDARPSTFTPLDIEAVSRSNKKIKVDFKKWIMAFIVLSLSLLIIYLIGPLSFFQHNLPAQNVEDIPVQSSEVELAVVKLTKEVLSIVPSEKIVPAKIQVTGLQINEANDFMELSLQLPVGAQSFLKRHSNNSYVFFISNAGKKIITPQIENNQWIESVVIDEVRGGFEIQFDTPGNILVETHHKEAEDLYHWVIRLKRSKRLAAIEAEGNQSKSAEVLVMSKQLPEVNNEGNAEALDVKPEQKPLKAVKLDIKPVKNELTDSELLHQAIRLIQQQNWLKAQHSLQKLVGSKVDKNARVKLLGLYQLRQKYKLFTPLLAESLELYPTESRLLAMHAQQLFSQNQFLKIINLYSKFVKQKSLMNLVAISYQRINQHDKAIVYYQKSLRVDPQQPRNWISLAISQEQESQFDQALQSYQIAQRSGLLNKKLQAFTVKRIQQLKTPGNS